MLITGGPDRMHRFYRWTVTNQGDRPIVEVTFPHYWGELFHPPPGWSAHCTGLVAVGVQEPRGACRVEADSSASALEPGQSAEFELRAKPVPSRPAPGVVTVRFADGSTVEVGGVLLPQPRPWLERYVTLIGLGGAFLLWVIVRSLRRRFRRAAPDLPGESR